MDVLGDGLEGGGVAGMRRTMVGGLSPSSPALLAPRSASKSLRDQGARSAPPPHFKSHCHEWEKSSKKVRWRDPVNATRAGKYPATLCKWVEQDGLLGATPSILNHTA